MVCCLNYLCGILLWKHPITLQISGWSHANIFIAKYDQVQLVLYSSENTSTAESLLTRKYPCYIHSQSVLKTVHISKAHILFYLFFSSLAGGIQQIQQSDWFLERAEFSNTDRCSGRNPSSWSIFVNELVVIVNLSPFLHLHRRLIDASLSLFTFRWLGKLM